MISRRTIGLIVAALLALLAFSWWREHRPAPTVAQAIAHERTRSDSVVAANADAVLLHDTVRVTVARVAYRTIRDSVRLTDTVWVRSALATADTVIALDSVAIADAGRAIEAHQAVESSLRTELTLALQPRTLPRFGTTISALYDPLGASPLVTAAVGFRVIGNVSLVGVAFQQVQLGAVPRVYFGISVRL